MEIVGFIVTFLMSLCVIGLCYSVIILFRNHKVYKLRIRMINEDYDLYHYLPEYDDMLYSIKPLKYGYWINHCVAVRDSKK